MSPLDAPLVPGQAIIVFDGVCVLCNGWVAFLLRHDRKQRFRFAAMQGASGARLLARHGLDPCDPMSFLLIDEHGARTDSDAVIAVLQGMGGVWRAASALRLVPGFMRDPLYRLVARNRYRWFGRKPACVVPRDDLRHRFLSGDDPGFL
ncbi:MAG: thiol-disulfide oxidoreductase DCC family protein [Luteimonas sp.]